MRREKERKRERDEDRKKEREGEKERKRETEREREREKQREREIEKERKREREHALPTNPATRESRSTVLEKAPEANRPCQVITDVRLRDPLSGMDRQGPYCHIGSPFPVT
jgi:hypothetical protein